MTDKRNPGSGSAGDGSDDASGGAGDGLDAWLAANFPAQPTEPAQPAQPVEPAQPVAPPTQPPAPVQPATTPVQPPPLVQPPAPLQPPAPAQPATPSAETPFHVEPPAPTPPPVMSPPTVPFGGLPTEPPAFPPMTEELEGIPAAAEFPPSPTEAFAEATGSSGLDSLFGETKFVEYDEGPSASENPFAKKPVDLTATSTDEDQPSDSNKKLKPKPVLLWVAGSLVAVLALGALFVLGTKLPALLGPAPGALVVPTASASPTPTEAPLGPVKPGEYVWNDLLGGECLDPYEGPWETKYTVVDCKKDHPAQLVVRGTFAPAEGVNGYPGIEALQAQVNLLCTSPAGVDYGKANVYTDIQFEASYALSEQEWFDGNKSYYCFLSRSSGEDLTGSISVPQVAPPPPAPPVEEPAP